MHMVSKLESDVASERITEVTHVADALVSVSAPVATVLGQCCTIWPISRYIMEPYRYEKSYSLYLTICGPIKGTYI